MAKIPTRDSVYEEIKKAGEKGKALRAKSKMPYLEELLREGKIKKVGSKYYLPEIEVPLGQRQVIERLLSIGHLKRSGKKYIIVEPEPSFSEFIETLQDIYLRKGKGYQESVSILPLVEELASEMGLPRKLVEKWILELPRIFIGVVGLRLFTGEPALELEDGRKVSRIYLEREIVGL